MVLDDDDDVDDVDVDDDDAVTVRVYLQQTIRLITLNYSRSITQLMRFYSCKLSEDCPAVCMRVFPRL